MPPFLPMAALTLALAFLSFGPTEGAAFPGANGLIAYTRYFHSTATSEFNCEVYTVDPVTKVVASLTNSPECESSPSWSPDGARIAVSRDGILWVMDADGSYGHPVGANVSAHDPAWSPDGRMIAFESSGEGGSLYVISADGGTPFRVAAAGGYAVDGGPSWSPDCKRIAFASGSGLSLVNPDGTGLELLANGNGPSWSPDGRRVAYNAYNSNPDISIIDVLTKERVDLGIDPSTGGEAPAWSPDGTRIAFTNLAETPETQNIYVVNLDGSGVRRLTEHNQGEQWSDWQPIANTDELPRCAFTVPAPTSARLPVGGGRPSSPASDRVMPLAAMTMGAVLMGTAVVCFRLSTRSKRADTVLDSNTRNPI